MIKSLHIANYALISKIDINFEAGLNIITGETGAGKSIILGALSLLLGGRADLKAIRNADAKSVIEAEFDISSIAGFNDVLRRAELDTDSDVCILRRELSPGGRSRAFVNDTPVTLAFLRDIAMRLVDIHSQHQNLLIADPAYQLSIIDSLARNGELKEKYAESYAAYRRALKKYTDTRDLIRRNAGDAEYLSFQLEEFEGLDLHDGEQESLEAERELLSNVGDIKELLAEAIAPLAGGESNAVEALRDAAGACESIASRLGTGDSDADPDSDISEDATDDPDSGGNFFRSLAGRLESARIEVADIADSLADYDARLQSDPGRLEEVEERLGAIYSLEMKHHADSIAALLKLRDDMASKLEAISNSEDVLGRLELAARRAKKSAVELATQLSEMRAATAESFAALLKERAAPLGMHNLCCVVSLTRGKLGPDGFDDIEFLFAFNKNQQPVPVAAGASGGEISRLMLTIKSIVAENMQMPSIIFDEVDTGVSGDIANRMAAMMAGIGSRIQVITITHLPGVASMGTAHFKVYKEDDESSATTRIRRLADDERAAELALMLSGNPSDPAALANARSLLAAAGRIHIK